MTKASRTVVLKAARIGLLAIPLWIVTSASALGGGGGVCETEGTSGPDVLHGTGGSDVICGLSGQDVIYGHGGTDWLIGGRGSDVIYGGRADDQLNGGQGVDYLTGQRGRDLLKGEGKADVHLGGRGRDCFDSKEQDLRGGDVIFGGPDRDYVLADPGDIVKGAGEAPRCTL